MATQWPNLTGNLVMKKIKPQELLMPPHLFVDIIYKVIHSKEFVLSHNKKTHFTLSSLTKKI